MVFLFFCVFFFFFFFKIVNCKALWNCFIFINFVPDYGIFEIKIRLNQIEHIILPLSGLGPVLSAPSSRLVIHLSIYSFNINILTLFYWKIYSIINRPDCSRKTWTFRKTWTSGTFFEDCGNPKVPWRSHFMPRTGWNFWKVFRQRICTLLFQL